MQGKKRVLADILYATGVTKLISACRKRFSKRLIILAYHRIYDLDVHGMYDSDEELVSASKKEFEWQVKFLMENYHVTTFEQYKALSNREKIDKDFVIITFDDGFGDNYYNAFPILKTQKCPAVFYISTDYIGESNRFWFEALITLIKGLDDSDWSEFCAIVGIDVSEDKNDIALDVLDSFKLIANDRRLDILNKLHLKFSGVEGASSDKYILPMNWPQVIEMAENGMEIGSHTKTHPILTNLNQTEVIDEILGSKVVIEEKTGKECVTISYPNGGAGDYNSSIINHVNEAGYSYACSYMPGVNRHEKLNEYELSRSSVERYITRSEFKLMLSIPSFFK